MILDLIKRKQERKPVLHIIILLKNWFIYWKMYAKKWLIEL